jgi:hypothetical protein
MGYVDVGLAVKIETFAVVGDPVVPVAPVLRAFVNREGDADCNVDELV